MGEKNERITLNELRAEAAEKLLERKRIGLECAIEALEVVGYTVTQDDSGSFCVSPPKPSWKAATASGIAESYGTEADLLEGYPVLLTVKEAAGILGVSHRTVSRLCMKNELPSFKIGRSVRINKNALVAYLS